MKFTLIRTDKKNVQHLTTKSAETFIERIQRDTKNGDLAQFRYFALRSDSSSMDYYFARDRIAWVYPSVEMRKTESGALETVVCNGVVALKVMGIMGREAQRQAKHTAQMLPSTLAVFTESTGKGIIILVRISKTDGSLPTAESDIDSFCRQGHQLAVMVYGGLFPQTILRENINSRTCFRMTYDDEPYLNVKASPLTVNMGDTTLRTMADANKAADTPQTPMSFRVYEEYEQTYTQAAHNARQAVSELPDSIRPTAYLTELSRQLCVLGMPEEEAMLHASNHLRFSEGYDERMLRSILTSVYAETKPDRRLVQAGMEMRQLIDMLNTRYQFRYNEVMGYTEYRRNVSFETEWQPVSDRETKGLTTELRLAGLNIWDKDVERYVKSNMIRGYNPIREYLWKCMGHWDGKDHIGRLAQTVPCAIEQWPRWFRKWLLYMVAQWLGRTRRYGNSVAPLLISRQGNNKSTFCRSLLPDELQWGYTDNLTIEDKRQTLQAMHNFLLINLDEFNQISPKIQEGFLKNIIQLASVKVKRPYGRHVEDFPRLASFIATSNMADVLSDPSGNRRFIGIELTGPIDISYRINHQQLYAQAMHALLDEEEQYWFTDDEVREIMQHNLQFRVQSPAEQYFEELFEPGNSKTGEWLTTAAIYDRLRHHAGASLPANGVRAFGRLLANLEGLEHRRMGAGIQHLVREK